MNKKEFDKITEGQRVIVSGQQEIDRLFEGVEGVVRKIDPDDYYGGSIKIRFDEWSSGHGPDDSEWNFYRDNAQDFTINLAPTPVVVPAKRKTPKGAQAYKGNGKHTWEDVAANTRRLRVPGGWCYLYSSGDETMTFVPVPYAVGYAV